MQFKLIRLFPAMAVSAALIFFSIGAGSASEEQFWTDTPEGGHVTKAQTLPDFVDLAAKLSPAVVNISTEGGEQSGGEGELPTPYGHQHGKSLGSGFIVSKDGYILTNEHVIENPTKVTVTLQDGHNYTAKVIGGDSKTDVALLKIDVGHELAVAPLGNSDDLKVGQWVMAIGNPFGFDHTVTVGVVSAKGRFLPDEVDQYIQTDASINPGNSGGPLIDLSGGVVGVNAAIFTSTGRSMGIGFAIPINLVKEELSELRDRGKVKHGWLGVMIQEVTPELAESMDLKEARGALVGQVLKDSPAAIAGVKSGDVIIEFDGHPIKDRRELPLLVTRTPLGKTVTFKVIRDKQEKDLVANITESHEAELAAAERQPKVTAGTPSSFGLRVQDLSPDLAHELGLDSGVMISGVDPGSRGDEVGLQAHDVILEVNRSPVKDVSSYQQALKAGGKGSIVLLLVKRGESTLYFALKPEA
jgi:serine protease Do